MFEQIAYKCVCNFWLGKIINAIVFDEGQTNYGVLCFVELETGGFGNDGLSSDCLGLPGKYGKGKADTISFFTAAHTMRHIKLL